MRRNALATLISLTFFYAIVNLVDKVRVSIGNIMQGKSTLTVELERQHLDEPWGFGLGSKGECLALQL